MLSVLMWFMTHSLSIAHYGMNRCCSLERGKESMHSANQFGSEGAGNSRSTRQDRPTGQRLGVDTITEWTCDTGESQDIHLRESWAYG